MIHHWHRDSRTIYMQNNQQQTSFDGDSKNMGKPQVPQRLGGFHYGHELAGVIPKQLVEQIQENDRGLMKPLRKGTKV